MLKKISARDLKHFKLLRKNVSSFIEYCASMYDKRDALLLDIAPQDHAGAGEWFRECLVETLDIDPKSKATYIADIYVK